MSNYFQENGYKTHLIGKWHLGHFQRKYTPTYRGFDSFFGYYNGAIDYYNYTWVQSPFPPGYDMRKNSDVNYLNLPGKYATEMFTDQALRIIDKHDDSKKSLFLMVNHLAVHAANDYDPLQAPAEEIAKFNYITNPDRKIFGGMEKYFIDLSSILNENNIFFSNAFKARRKRWKDRGGFKNQRHFEQHNNHVLR